jgi:hypothetical protein
MPQVAGSGTGSSRTQVPVAPAGYQGGGFYAPASQATLADQTLRRQFHVAPKPVSTGRPVATTYVPLQVAQNTARVNFAPTVKAVKVKAPTITGSTAPAFKFNNNNRIDPNVGQVAQQDWGMDAAAQAQIALLQDSNAANVAAVREQEIARGMGGSGVAIGAEANQDRLGQLDINNTLAQSAAEQGRLNQQVALQNGTVSLDLAKANQATTTAETQLRVSYDQFMRQYALDTQMGNASTRLAYANFAESQRQYDNTLAQQRTIADRDYQMQRLTFNQGGSQFAATLAANNANSAADRQQAALIASLQAGASAAPKTPQAQFEADLPDVVKWVASNGDIAGDPTRVMAMLQAQYPGVDLTRYPSLMSYLGYDPNRQIPQTYTGLLDLLNK